MTTLSEGVGEVAAWSAMVLVGGAAVIVLVLLCAGAFRRPPFPRPPRGRA